MIKIKIYCGVLNYSFKINDLDTISRSTVSENKFINSSDKISSSLIKTRKQKNKFIVFNMLQKKHILFYFTRSDF